MSYSKKELRKKVLSQRKNLSQEFIARASEQITANLWAGPLQNISSKDTVMGYIPTKGEVDTYPLINQLLQKKTQVVLPRTYPREKTMEAVPITDLNSDLEKGAYDIYEPKPSLTALPEIDTISVVIVPGVAYDKSGFRLGFGGGYYDRFIDNDITSVKLIAVAYDFQVFENIPKDDWDKPVDVLVTEQDIIYIS